MKQVAAVLHTGSPSGTCDRAGSGGDQLALGRRAERQARYRSGLFAEMWAGLALMAKGYRILARRHKTRCGEIDLIATRGNTVVFVEVKKRCDLESAAAAMTARQSHRLRRAATAWLAGRAHFHEFELRCDAVFVTPGSWPKHIAGGA